MAHSVNGNGYEHNHEERIQRLEDSNKNVSVQVGVLGIKITNMSESIDTKLDSLSERLESTGEKLDKASEAIGHLGAKVVKLEEVHVVEKARWSSVKGWIVAAIAGSLGIIATKLVELYWR